MLAISTSRQADIAGHLDNASAILRLLRRRDMSLPELQSKVEDAMFEMLHALRIIIANEQ